MAGFLPLAPLRHTAFRRLWIGGAIANMGGMIQSVGAGWLMASIVKSSDMVAFVQAASTLPVMLLSVPSGVLADLLDRQRVLLSAQVLRFLVSALMAAAVLSGTMEPWLLLLLTFVMGCGTALHTPSWQASVGDVVPREDIPSAVTLNSMGLNLTRSTGPALGGFVVATAGAGAAFVLNALCYLPLIFSLSGHRAATPLPALPSEDFGRAILAGFRYALMSPNLLRVMLRGFVFGASAISILALLPVVARDFLGGGAMTYGLLLGSFGVGAVGGGLSNTFIRRHLSTEGVVKAAFFGFALCSAGIGFSRSASLTAVLLIPAGAFWVLALSLFNVVVQLATPRWVVGRVLALYQTASFGGMTLGAWAWGHIAEAQGAGLALYFSAGVSALGAAMGLILAMPGMSQSDLAPLNRFKAPDPALDVTPRSGPIRVLVDYEVAPEDDAAFFAAMADRRRAKIRDGAVHWVLMRDVETPTLWKETYTYPTWTEYLRSNQRPTKADAAISEKLRLLTLGAKGPTVHRMIELHAISGQDPLAIRPDTIN